jgi:hypothetical protein
LSIAVRPFFRRRNGSELFPLVRCELTLVHAAAFHRWQDKENPPRENRARRGGPVGGSLGSGNFQSDKVSIGATFPLLQI